MRKKKDITVSATGDITIFKIIQMPGDYRSRKMEKAIWKMIRRKKMAMRTDNTTKRQLELFMDQGGPEAKYKT